MKKIKHIIWDWNGTLLNDLDVSIDALNYILRQEQLPEVTQIEEYRKYFQFPVIEYYKKVGFDFHKTPFSELAKAYMAQYQPKSLQCDLHVGVKKTLETAKRLGYQQYLLSASNLQFLHEQLAVYDIAPYFNAIKGLDNIHAHSKAELAKAFVQSSDMNPSEVVFVGDSVHDSEVAKYAGCNCILIAAGHEHKDKLCATGYPVFHTINDFCKYLEK